MSVLALWRREGLEAVTARLNRAGRWTARPYAPADENDVLRLFSDTYGHEIAPEVWRWKYLRNPAGKPVMICARDNAAGRLVGFAGAMPATMDAGGKTVACYQGTDAMVHPSFRRTGLFVDINIRVFDGAFTAGGFGAGLPNDQALSINLGMGFRVLDTFRVYAGVFNWPNAVKNRLWRRWLEGPAAAAGRLLSRPLNRAAPAPGVRELSEPPAEAAAFCRRALARTPLAFERSAERLRWRYFERPGRPYFLLAQEGPAGMEGLLAGTVFEAGGLQVGAVAEFVPAARDGGLALLRDGLDRLRAAGADVAVAMTPSASPLRPVFARAGLFSSTLLWTRRPFHFVINLGPLEHETTLNDPRAWHYGLGDSDLV